MIIHNKIRIDNRINSGVFMNGKSTILIVEDEAVNREILHFMLQDQFNIIEAVNGADGLDKLRDSLEDGVAAVLLDLIMPKKDGFYFLEEYNKSEELKRIPVIVSTISGDNETETRCLQMGVWDFIRKPYNADIIRFRIKNCIERSELYILKEMRYREDYDGLTDIYKKNKFFNETKKLLEKYPEDEFVFVRLDIHKFQLINLFYGVETGDKLIRYVADFLVEDAHAGWFDTYGRIEADVFCICGRNANLKIIEEYIAHVREKLTQFGLDFEILPVFGIYLITDKNESINDMYDKANLASKKSKGNYMENYCFYEDQMSKDIVKEQVIVNNMNHALELEQFVLYLQPKYELKNNTLEGAEVLVRWQDPEKGLISPGEFIPVFEHNGFIMKLDNYVWEHTCMLLKRWMDEGKKVFPVSVNISRVSLYNPRLVDIIEEIVNRYDIPPYLLQLELTESAYTNNPIAISEAMKKLQEKGFMILMDDFGSGYSSLNVLKDISVDILKIDMKFLSDTDENDRGENILAAVVRMAKWLEMPVIAEGVEKEEQVEFLKSIGCEYVQGYYFARPMPVDEFEKLAYEELPGHISDNSTSADRNKTVLWNTAIHMENLFANTMQAVAICEFDGDKLDVTRVNDAYYHLFGYEDISYSKLKILDTVHENYRQTVLDCFCAVIENMGTAQCEFIKIAESGLGIWVDMKLKYINQVGTRHVIVATLTDITEQKRIDQELQRYRNAINFVHKDREKFLVVDDEEMNRVILRSIFEKEYDIIEACNGQDALNILKEDTDVDLILLDVMMPVMDGPAFLKVKNTIDRISSIPVIIITADHTVQQQINTLALGANDYILKPFIPETVKRRVKNVMESTRRLGAVLEKAGVMDGSISLDVRTGLYTGNDAGKIIDTQLARMKDLQAMILIDINNYEEINQKYGRIVGDRLIKTFAAQLKNNFRKSDIISRYSGKEFILFVSGAPTAECIIERCEEIVHSGVREGTAMLNCAIGVAFAIDKQEGFASLLEKADNALYIAKNRGDNQCVIYEDHQRGKK